MKADPADWHAITKLVQLHQALGDLPARDRLPIWFNEGVAQSFASARLPAKAWGLMTENRTWIPFKSLDGTFTVFEGTADARLAYAQSYAMVELMRECGGAGAIAVARKELGTGVDTPTVLAHACRRDEVAGAELLEFLGRRLATRDAR